MRILTTKHLKMRDGRTTMILKEIDKIDRAIIALYEPFDVPVDELIVDDESLKRFSSAVIRVTSTYIWSAATGRGYKRDEFEDIVQRRLLYLRRRAADRRRQGLPALAKLGRKWEGPNQPALNAKVEELLDAS
jgi:hypothetical protein